MKTRSVGRFVPLSVTLFVLLFTQGVLSEPVQKLNILFDEYFEQRLKQDAILALWMGERVENLEFNIFSETAVNARIELESRFLHRINKIDTKNYQPSVLIDVQIFRDQRASLLKSPYTLEVYSPEETFAGWMTHFISLGSGRSKRSFTTVNDYESWYEVLGKFIELTDDIEARWVEGRSQGICMSSFQIDKLIYIYTLYNQSLIENNVFYTPVNQMPSYFSANEKQYIILRYRSALTKSIIPGFSKLITFLDKKYRNLPCEDLTRKKANVALHFYQSKIDRVAGKSIDLEVLYNESKIAIEHLSSKWNDNLKEMNISGDFKSTLTQFSTKPQYFSRWPTEFFSEYQNIAKQVNQSAIRFFSSYPRSTYDLQMLPATNKTGGGPTLIYQPYDEQRKQGAVIYVNGNNYYQSPKWLMMSQFLIEGFPGQHFETAFHTERKYLFAYRDLSSYPAYTSGWRAYCEYLGSEMGLYSKQDYKLGYYYSQIQRHLRVMLDIGINKLLWDDIQAKQFVRTILPMPEQQITVEISRVRGFPGSVLFEQIGRQTFLELREEAQTQLGVNFDLKEFHHQLLINGRIPLNVLEKQIHQWIKQNSKVASIKQ